jgi:asparagine synthase (glutamine-hydrolysing)
MCGIIGAIHDVGVETERLGLEMLEQIRYRGPDAGYLHLDDWFFLGLRRLAIVNIAKGHQPTRSEDGAVVAVFNGEIYNHLALKQELESDGFRVRDGSDAEVIPHAYQKWGLNFAAHFNGDFAIALFDQQQRRMILVRDRLGIKPLYYTQLSDGVAFASELSRSLFIPRSSGNSIKAILRSSTRFGRASTDRLLSAASIKSKLPPLSSSTIEEGKLIATDIGRSRIARACRALKEALRSARPYSAKSFASQWRYGCKRMSPWAHTPAAALILLS